MRTSRRGLALIEEFEGFAAMPYHCPAGLLTVGYGHVIRPGEAADYPWSITRARTVLAVDVQVAEAAVRRLIHVRLGQGQFDALVSFTFNLGAGRLQMATLRQVVNRGEHAAVPAQLARWVYAGGRVLPGLVRRRAAEIKLYQSDMG